MCDYDSECHRPTHSRVYTKAHKLWKEDYSRFDTPSSYNEDTPH